VKISTNSLRCAIPPQSGFEGKFYREVEEVKEVEKRRKGKRRQAPNFHLLKAGTS
jgi:hypothetical protein